MRSFNLDEVIVVGVLIKVKEPTTVPEKYKGIFHGHTEIEKGSYVYWYPARDTSYSRLINELERWYGMKMEYGVLGTMEI